MTTVESLRAAVNASPLDASARLILADALADAGDTRGERVQRNAAALCAASWRGLDVTGPFTGILSACASWHGFTGRTITLVADDKVTQRQDWDEGSCTKVMVLAPSRVQEEEAERTGVILPGTVVAVLRYSRGAPSLSVHALPDTLLSLVPGKDFSAPFLKREEKIVLAATRSLKSSYGGVKNYRFVEARRETGISAESWESAVKALQDKGLLRYDRAITPAGRNAIGGAQLWELRPVKETETVAS